MSREGLEQRERHVKARHIRDTRKIRDDFDLNCARMHAQREGEAGAMHREDVSCAAGCLNSFSPSF